MKSLINFLGLAALLAGMWSCSKDPMEDWKMQPLEEDQTFFVNIAVNGTEGTRAEPNFDQGTTGQYNDGKADENAVKTIYFIFYDENGDRVATTQVRKDNADVTTPTPEASHNAYYSGIVQIDIKHGSLPPTSVMAFVNPITSSNFDINPSFATLEELGKTTRPRLIDDAGFFAMSKSSYYKNFGTEEAPNYKRVITTPLEQGQLVKSADEAKANLSDASKRVDIYVERYAAKVSLDIKSEDPKMYVNLSDNNTQDDDKIVLTFVPEYWAVNAYESETYITKSFYTSGMDDILKYTDLNIALGGDESMPNEMPWTWNSPANHRSYWAQSPAYYKSTYPRTADDIKDNGEKSYALGYYSYNDLKEEAQGNIINKARDLRDSDDNKDQNQNHPIYVRENTIAGSAIRKAYEDEDASPKAALPSVILVGHYTVTIGEEGQPETLKENEFFYVMGNATNGYSFYREDDMLKYFVGTTVQFSTTADGKTPIFRYTTLDDIRRDFTEAGTSVKNYFEIKHPAQAAREGLVIDSRFVTIQLNEEVVKAVDNDDPKMYAYIEDEWIPVIADNLNKINKQMLYTAGTAQGFEGGRAYYTIPIKHLGFYRDGNTNNVEGKDSPNRKGFDWLAVRTGDFGLVRNHSYKIVITKIEGLGNAIPDPTEPIVPPTDPEEYYIGARLIVLNWALVNEQREEL